MQTNDLSLRKVIDNLDDLKDEDISRIEAYFEEREETSTQPWFIRGCAGISAWIASLFIIGFLAIADIITDSTGAIAVGLMLCAIGIAISRSKVDNDFASQGALAICLAGQLLFVFGLRELRWQEPLTITLLLIVALEVLLIWLYSGGLLRFISTLTIVSAITALIYDLEITNLIPFFVIFLVAGSVFLWENELYFATSKFSAIYRPVGTGVTIAALALVSFPVVQISRISLWWVSTIGLLIVLLWVTYTIIAANDVNLQSRGAAATFAGAIVIAIPGIQIPGLVASLAILLHSFHRGNRFLLGVAGAFMAYFVTLFYYDLENTLLQKSFALLGSGLVFLLIRYLAMNYLFEQEDK